jgi:hypothetical protein
MSIHGVSRCRAVGSDTVQCQSVTDESMSIVTVTLGPGLPACTPVCFTTNSRTDFTPTDRKLLLAYGPGWFYRLVLVVCTGSTLSTVPVLELLEQH